MSKMTINNIYRILASWLLIILLASSGYAKVMPIEFDEDRNRLIAYILSHQLPAQHYAHKNLDEISAAAFDLYLKQLDPRKRFLLTEDVKQLEIYADRIDDELRKGKVELPDAGMNLLNRRIKEVEIMAGKLLAAGFDHEKEDYLELDPKKIEYAATGEELRDRWRRVLKLQVLESYLDFIEEKEKKSDVSLADNLKKEDPIADSSFDRELWDQAMAKVSARTTRSLHRLRQENRQDHYNRYFDAVARAFDPHSNYMAPVSKQDFDIHMSGSLEGIGALLREDEGQIKVVRVIPGSAAALQGDLQAEDTILSVAEKEGEPIDITDMRIREAVSFIRGPKGTEVVLTVLKPDGLKRNIAIVRDVVQIEETYVKSEVLLDEHGGKIGYIKIPSFYRDFAARESMSARNVTDDTARELQKLNQEKITGLILDLRNNGGGSLTDAVEVSGLFLPGGPVVQVKNSRGEIKILEDADSNVLYNGPILVLVNKFSASASEILAAALQDYERAIVIGGDHTHGKGTVQSLIDLNNNIPLLHRKKYQDLGALKVTIQKFYRINGESTQYKGVEPDIVVPTMLDYLKSGEKFQDYSLPWDRVPVAKYIAWQNRLDIHKAQEISRQWMEGNPDIEKIIEQENIASDRSERTRMAVYLEGVMEERKELASLSDTENRLLQMDDVLDEQMPDQDEKKPLKDQLQEDPYVNLAVHLISAPTFFASTTTK
ncbi:MAG: carboxy terminal-processing peptidase [Desulfobulbaceae bacterium]|nr:carboxy terminal-processing peptidase [Desulfobulbaceae bacterium]